MRKYKDEKISLKDLSTTFPNLYYLKNEIDAQRVLDDKMYSFEKLIQIINCNKGSIDTDLIIIDDTLKKYLQSTYSDKYFLESHDCEKETVCVCQTNSSGELYSPDAHTKKVLLMKSVHDTSNQHYRSSIYNMRLAIPAFKEYEMLATKLDKLYFVGVENYAKWYIVSPVSKSDYPKIFEMTEESFVNHITSKDTFRRLVAYVTQNNKDSSITDIKIIEGYKKFIGEYYKLAKENRIL